MAIDAQNNVYATVQGLASFDATGNPRWTAISSDSVRFGHGRIECYGGASSHTEKDAMKRSRLVMWALGVVACGSNNAHPSTDSGAPISDAIAARDVSMKHDAQSARDASHDTSSHAARDGSPSTAESGARDTGGSSQDAPTHTASVMKFLNSGDPVDSVSNGFTSDGSATWLATDTWQNVNAGNWLSANSAIQSYVTAHPHAIYDFGVPLAANQDFAGAASGAHDADFTAAVGNWVAAGFGGTTINARLQWEFNSSSSVDAATFVSAWTHVVPVLRQAASADGITLNIVWCPNAANPLPAAYYPGDGVVDIIAADIYAWDYGTNQPSAAQVVSAINGFLTALEQFATAHHKPQALGEFANTSASTANGGNGYGCGDCAEPITQGYQPWETRNRGTDHAVAYVSYYNLTPGGVGETLDGLPNTLAALKAWVADARAH